MTALITGASTGIGYELAKVFAENGHDLVLVARNQAQLEQLAAEIEGAGKVKARVIVKDLSVPTAPKELFDELMADGMRIDVLVNNAGFGNHGRFAEIELDADMRLLEVNICALTALCKLFIREMLARHSGRILNVASTAAFQGGPLMATYYASKAYVLHFSEALARENVRSGVTVTALCPGPVNTEFQKRAGIEGSRLFKSGTSMSARQVAELGFKGTMHGRRVVIAGVMNLLIAESVRLIPRRLATYIAGKLNDVR